MNTQALPSTRIKGRKVVNLNGERLRKIQDLMIELKSGKVLYAVLSFGGFFGLGCTYFALPIEALVFGDTSKNFIKADLDKEMLKKAKGFDKNNWPIYSTAEECVRSLYDFYEYKKKSYSPKFPRFKFKK